MSQLIVSEFVTLDGVMEAPGGEPSHPHTGWVGDLMGPNAQAYKSAEVFEAEALLLGRVTYESFAGAWPTYEGPMADRMNSMPKHVVSSRLTDPEWNGASVISGDIIAEITKLKESDGGPLMVNGSATLVHALIEHDLVDVYRLMVFPVSIGGGLRVFPDSRKKTALRAVETVAYENDVVLNVYEPAS